ncbi:RND efflux pump, membrane fusion protein [Moorella glycerini]|uniref:Macrolide export protein MacA n=1 Tax=Neomoorella stamsii TaxID=1266720 RepID=A0A9X7P512_9FIRM|nr:MULTISPECIES: efflux RND transporter periplasmic adaptor subunit [Moorella]PRR70001.1 Macrolide export protein MacA [Moorella stamsii]CEP68448.1 RND efflux pump, membrane fusion protein [Moorella glycerini]
MRLKRNSAGVILALFLLAVTLGGCGKKPASQVETPRVAVEVAQVKRGSIAQPVRVTGTVQAGATVQVMAAIPGKIKLVLVDVGDKVSQGQVIAELENSDIEARLQQAKANLEQARLGLDQADARVKQAEVRAGLDETNLKRTQTLFDQGAASQQQLDAARTAAAVSQEDLAVARASLAASRAQVTAAEAAVRQAEVALENTYIKAPVSGEVAARLLEPGALAQGAVVTLVTSGERQVEIGVTEQDVNYLQPGREVAVEVPVVAAESLKGRVASVSPAADERSRVFKVKVSLVNAPPGVKPGMAATVIYTTRQVNNALLVPKNAVVKRGAQDIVYTVVEGKAAGRVVTTGIADDKNVEIVKGLADQDSIIVKGQDFVSEGQPVEVVNGGAGA